MSHLVLSYFISWPWTNAFWYQRLAQMNMTAEMKNGQHAHVVPQKV